MASGSRQSQAVEARGSDSAIQPALHTPATLGTLLSVRRDHEYRGFCLDMVPTLLYMRRQDTGHSLADGSGVGPNEAAFSRRVMATFSGPYKGSAVSSLSLGSSGTFR